MISAELRKPFQMLSQMQTALEKATEKLEKGIIKAREIRVKPIEQQKPLENDSTTLKILENQKKIVALRKKIEGVKETMRIGYDIDVVTGLENDLGRHFLRFIDF